MFLLLLPFGFVVVLPEDWQEANRSLIATPPWAAIIHELPSLGRGLLWIPVTSLPLHLSTKKGPQSPSLVDCRLNKMVLEPFLVDFLLIFPVTCSHDLVEN